MADARYRKMFEGNPATQLVLDISSADMLRMHVTDLNPLRTSDERFRKQYKGFSLPTCSWHQDGADFLLQEFNDASEANTPGSDSRVRRHARQRSLRGLPEILANLHARRAVLSKPYQPVELLEALARIDAAA